MNLYKLFVDLLPSEPQVVGNIIATTDGTATIQLPDGGIVQARGDGAVGDRVFVKGGVIEGAAPNLPFESIDV